MGGIASSDQSKMASSVQTRSKDINSNVASKSHIIAPITVESVTESRQDSRKMDVQQPAMEDDGIREETMENNRGVRFSASHEEGSNQTPRSSNLPDHHHPGMQGIVSALRSTRHVHPNVLNMKTPSPSVFERLAKTETVASIQAKFLPQNKGRRARSRSEPPKNRQRARTKSDEHSPFNKNPSKQKKIMKSNNTEKKSTKHHSTNGPTLRASTRINIRKKSSSWEEDEQVSVKDVGDLAVKKSRFKKVLSKPITMRRRRSSSYKVTMPSSPTKSYETGEEGPPLSIEFSKMMRLICSNKYTPELGFVELDLKPLRLTSAFAEYATGAMSSKNLAATIINALFLRDLPGGISWNIHEPLERELVMPIGEEGYSFFVDATASKFDDEYSNEGNTEGAKYNRYTASATGSLIFVPVRSEIHVENYSCVHSVYDDDNEREGLEGFTF